jgi:hypothetical protein
MIEVAESKGDFKNKNKPGIETDYAARILRTFLDSMCDEEYECNKL